MFVCFYCPSSYYISLRSLICILGVIIAEEVAFHFNFLICSHLFLFTSFAVSHCFEFAVVVVACFDIFFPLHSSRKRDRNQFPEPPAVNECTKLQQSTMGFLEQQHAAQLFLFTVAPRDLCCAVSH